MPLNYSQFTDEDGKTWNRWLGDLMLPAEWDPNSQVFVAIAPPDGYTNLPDPSDPGSGPAPTLVTAVDVTELEHDDPTALSAEFTETAPDVYQLSLTLRKGDPGDEGTLTILAADDLTGTPTAGYVLAVDSATTGVEIVPVKLGGQHWPGAVSNLSDTGTLCSVSVAAQPFDWRPRVFGQCQVTGAASDVRVDVIARLDNSSTGDIVGRGYGQAGVSPPRNDLVSGVPTGSASTVGKVLAGAAAVIYFRAEKQAGSSAFTTSSSTTSFYVEVAPIP